MKIVNVFTILILLTLFVNGAYAQDFGFGFDEEAGAEETAPVSKRASPVKISGEIAVELAPYVYDFDKENNAQAISYRDIFSGKLKLSASAGNVDAYAAFNLNANSISELWDEDSPLGDPSYTPLIMDEAYLRGYIGPVNIEAGLRKLSWGKADSLGPLDVTNPLDYSALRNISDIQAIKIARPMLHVTWNAAGFSKLEAVFIPNFAGHRFAQGGRWAASQFTDMSSMEKGFSMIADKKMASGEFVPIMSDPAFASMIPVLFGAVKSNLTASLGDDFVSFPSTGGLNYFQTGLRFTTTVGPADIGAQYYYGNLFLPDVTIGGVDAFLTDLVKGNIPSSPPPPPPPTYFGNADLLSAQIKYNRYHQLGVDYAQVLFDFNVRAEFAIHLTDDLKGDDGSVRNPFIGWSLGFDRDLFWGINANIQCNETIRLLNSKVGSNPILDCEADTNVTSTRFTLHFSKKFFRDELESKATVIWDIENMDCYLIPGLAWTVRDLTVELSAGVFAGEKSGDLGQYWENSFVKAGVKDSF
jgi:hypothetical protein